MEQIRRHILKYLQFSCDFEWCYYNAPEPLDNLITWVYERGSFAPTAKLTPKDNYSIISDYIQAYDTSGELVWRTDYDIYGDLTDLKGQRHFVPFRQAGQYEDSETGLYYNRFRYYSPEEGMYLSQDPIGLAGGTALYSYVHDPNSWIDVFGLSGLTNIQQQINAVLKEHLAAIQKIDPNAIIGYRGSTASGISKVHDPNLARAIDLNNFDVDAFIISDYLAADPTFSNRRRLASELGLFDDIESSIDRQLRDALPGLRNESFGFRIFFTHEVDALRRGGDVQIRITCPN